MFTGIAIYGYSDHRIDITIEFILKNHFKTYIALICLPVLSYMVTPITEWISPSNSYKKTILEPVEFSLKNDTRNLYTHLYLIKLPKMVGLFTTLILPLNSY